VGNLSINNKIDIEIEFEVDTVIDHVSSTRGWQVNGVLIQVGSKLLVIDYPHGMETYRVFTTIEMSDAFPGGPSTCGDEIPFLFVGSVIDDGPCPGFKRTQNCTANTYIVYAYPRVTQFQRSNAPYPSNPGFYTHNYTMCCTCEYRAQKISELSFPCTGPTGTPLGCYRDTNFASAYPNGLTIGCGINNITFTSSFAVSNFMNQYSSQFGAAQALSSSYINPTTTNAGKFAGEQTSISLNDRFDRFDVNWASSCNFLRNLYICFPAQDCDAFDGFQISQLIDYGNQVLGGCADGNADAIVKCYQWIETVFDNGNRLINFENSGFNTVRCRHVS